MKKIFATITLLLFLQQINFACDACGCSLGGNYYGILPQFGKNFVGLRWSQAKFYAYMDHQSEYLEPEHSNDTYNKLEVWGRFYVNKKLQVFAFIPYSFNHMDGTHQTIHSNGLSDITLSVNYLVVNTGEEWSKKIKHTWSIGTGIKIPTGKYTLEDKGKLVNSNFQLGTGSTDFLFSSIYTVRYQKLGSNIETGYKLNTANKNDYKFGNQFYAAYQFFYWQRVKSVVLLPNAGLFFEQAQRHKEENTFKTNTGGYALLATAGLEIYIGNFTIGANYKHPLVQHFNSDNITEIKSKDRLTTSVTFNF